MCFFEILRASSYGSKGGIQVWGWYDVVDLAARWSKGYPSKWWHQKVTEVSHITMYQPQENLESSNLRVPESTQNIDSYVLIIYQIDNTVSLILWSLNIWENCWIKTFSKLLSTPSLTDILSLQSEEITKIKRYVLSIHVCLPLTRSAAFFHWAFSKKIYSWLPVVGNRHSFSKKAPMSSTFHPFHLITLLNNWQKWQPLLCWAETPKKKPTLKSWKQFRVHKKKEFAYMCCFFDSLPLSGCHGIVSLSDCHSVVLARSKSILSEEANWPSEEIYASSTYKQSLQIRRTTKWLQLAHHLPV